MGSFFEDLLAGDRAAIMMAAALYFALAGTYSIWFSFRLRTWPSAVATLHTAGLTQFGADARSSDHTFHADVSYSFEVDGKTYDGDRLSPSYMVVSANFRPLLRWQLKGITHVGENSALAFYKPTNPAKSYLIVPSLRTIGVVALLTYGIAFLLLMAI